MMALGKPKMVNAESRHKQHPDTFWIAPASERRGLEEGDWVKLAWEDKKDEGGWRDEVIITKATGKGKKRRYKAKYDAEGEEGRDTDKVISFGPQHIFNYTLYEDSISARSGGGGDAGKLLGVAALAGILGVAWVAWRRARRSAAATTMEGVMVGTLGSSHGQQQWTQVGKAIWSQR